MTPSDKNILTAEVEVNAPIEKVWRLWTNPGDIMEWNNLSDDWHNTKVENDARTGGKFLYMMGLKDGSFSFDFCGTYDEVRDHEYIACTLDDGRTSTVTFTTGDTIKITETFEPNSSDSPDMQRNFCQAVLDRFKRYAERI